MTAVLNERAPDLDLPVSTTYFDLCGDAAQAWVVVDSMVDGIAMGGTRMTPGVDQGEVAELAQAMSTKLALAGIRAGGAKAGIKPSADTDVDRDQILRSFGHSVRPLLHGGIYLGCDQGTTHADRDMFFAAADYGVADVPTASRIRVTWPELWSRLADITGSGVGLATTGALAAARRSDPQRVIVQGFGTVGRAAASYLADRGHTIVAVVDIMGTIEDPAGLSIPELMSITDRAGTVDRGRLPERIHTSPAATERWLDIAADVTVLAAGAGAITESRVARVQSNFVVEGGNMSCTPGARRALLDSGICVLPDVIVNVGGAAVTGSILTGLAPSDVPFDQLEAWLRDWIGRTIASNCADVARLFAEGDTHPVQTLLSVARGRG